MPEKVSDTRKQNLLTKLFAAAVIVLLAVGALSQLIGSLENFFSDEQDRDSA